jgi:hypothetical protein
LSRDKLTVFGNLKAYDTSILKKDFKGQGKLLLKEELFTKMQSETVP